MNYLNQKKFQWRLFIGTILVASLLMLGNSSSIQAAEKITLYQDHHYGKYDEDGDDSSYYSIYPNDKFKDYKKFMKFTYKISDDSVIGLRINGNVDFDNWIYDIDDNGKQRLIPPNDIKVHALGPGTSTLKVYNGTKLIDSYTFNVTVDSTLSPSSFVDNTKDYCSDKAIQLIKKFALAGANEKNVTTNQRVLAALNAVVGYGCNLISWGQYDKWQKKLTYDDFTTYYTVDSRLLLKKALPGACAMTNKAILDNLGFQCTVEQRDDDNAYNTIEIYKKNEDYEEELKDREENPEFYEVGEDEVLVDELVEGEFSPVSFKATTKLISDYDFTIEEPDSIYTRTHLPSWIINADTKQQVIDVGQTVKLNSSDMNSNIFSSDTSIVTAADGKITGVMPGVAIVYRYNDTYCDVFYVLVSRKGAPKTVQAKAYKKSIKSYFSSSDYAPYILGGGEKICQVDDWNSLRIYDLEPIFGHGGSLKTSYSKGKIKCYVEYNGKSELIYTVGSGKYAE